MISYFAQDCIFGHKKIGFSDKISHQERLVRYVKLRIESYHGKGGGLRHFSLDGPIKPGGSLELICIAYYQVIPRLQM